VQHKDGHTAKTGMKEKIMEKDKIQEGWLCPRCGSVNAPQKDKCQCVKAEDTEKDSRQLLVE
jgi:ribosomal protein S27AE